jgi:hypothetical protein
VSDEDRNPPGVGRRRFVAWSVGAGIASLSGGLAALLARDAASKDTPPPPPPAPAAPPEISDEARALHSILIARYGKDLDTAQNQSLLEAVQNNVQSGKALRAKKLFNGEEPASIFAATPQPPPPPDAPGSR